MLKLVLVLLLAGAIQDASAQRPVLPPHPVPSRPAHHYPFPLLFFSDYLDSAAGYSPPSQPPVVVLQAPAAISEPAPVPAPAESLLIELKGDRYVRVSGEESTGSDVLGSSTSASPRQDVPATVLVFRDGHREEVAAYTIADGFLYAQGNYYTDGSWNRKIELSSLNIPETIEVCNSRGVRFRLPAAPNEVVTRP